MKLVEVQIIDFKSIKNEVLTVNQNQLCLVGKNESGKSSFIQAISYLNIIDTELTKNLLNKNSENYPNGLPVIIGKFQVSKQTYNKLHNLLSDYLSKENHGKFPMNSDKCFLQLKRWGNGFSNISISISIKDKFALNLSDSIQEKAKFYNSFFVDVFPNIDYFDNEELLIEPSTVDELLGQENKFETFRRLLFIGGCDNLNNLKNTDINFISTYLSNIEIKLNSIFKKHYKQDESINIRIIPSFGDRLTLIIRDNTQTSFSIKERSPGFQYYFAFLVNKLYFKKKNNGKNSIVLLDEPGNNLHPKGAKDLLISFNEIAETSQLFYTTHNPFLAIRNCVESLLFINKSPTNGSKINKKPFLNKYQILRKELGIVLNDSFLIGDINLIVEGNTEKLAFHRLFQDEKYRELEWLNIYNADGVNNIPQAINYLGKNNLNLSGIVILDSDKEAENVKVKKSYKKNIGELNWEELEINSVFRDKKSRTFEDLFPQEIYIKAFNEYCNSLKDLEVFDRVYVDYPYTKDVEPPIIDILGVHFKKFLPENSKSSITKQDVIRHLLDYVEGLPQKEQNKHLEKTFKLLDKLKSAYNKIEKHVPNQA